MFSVEDKYSHTHTRARTHTHSQQVGLQSCSSCIWCTSRREITRSAHAQIPSGWLLPHTVCVRVCVCADLYSHSGFSFSKRFHCLFFQHCSEPPLLHPALNFHRGVNVRPRPLTDALMHTHTHTRTLRVGGLLNAAAFPLLEHQEKPSTYPQPSRPVMWPGGPQLCGGSCGGVLVHPSSLYVPGCRSSGIPRLLRVFRLQEPLTAVWLSFLFFSEEKLPEPGNFLSLCFGNVVLMSLWGVIWI